jgi:polyketide synthase 12/myxalamid-type polyketide synthase MxaF
MAVDRLDPQTPLGSFGLESLMAMELRGRMEASLRTRIPVTFIWNYPTVRGMAQHLATHLYEGPPVASREGADAVAVPPAPAAPAEAVTDEDALRQLMGGDS